jgi:hypothetical protein
MHGWIDSSQLLFSRLVDRLEELDSFSFAENIFFETLWFTCTVNFNCRRSCSVRIKFYNISTIFGSLGDYPIGDKSHQYTGDTSHTMTEYKQPIYLTLLII